MAVALHVACGCGVGRAGEAYGEAYGDDDGGDDDDGDGPPAAVRALSSSCLTLRWPPRSAVDRLEDDRL